MVEKGQKNQNYSNISDTPRGKMPLYEDYFMSCSSLCLCVIPEVWADDCGSCYFIKLPHLISAVTSCKHKARVGTSKNKKSLMIFYALAPSPLGPGPITIPSMQRAAINV